VERDKLIVIAKKLLRLAQRISADKVEKLNN
jgi:hypothetical protein